MRRGAVAKLTGDVPERSADTPLPDTTNTIQLQDSDDKLVGRTADNVAYTAGPCEPRLPWGNGPTALPEDLDSMAPKDPYSL